MDTFQMIVEGGQSQLELRKKWLVNMTVVYFNQLLGAVRTQLCGTQWYPLRESTSFYMSTSFEE